MLRNPEQIMQILQQSQIGIFFGVERTILKILFLIDRVGDEKGDEAYDSGCGK